MLEVFLGQFRFTERVIDQAQCRQSTRIVRIQFQSTVQVVAGPVQIALDDLGGRQLHVVINRLASIRFTAEATVCRGDASR